MTFKQTISEPMRKLLFATAGAVLLRGACAVPPPSAPPSVPAAPALPPLPPPAGRCNADAGQFALGQTYTERIAEAVRSASGARIARALRPGQVVTREYAGDRINLTLDAADRVVGVGCG
ncbi:MAG: proteinase inhibitor [Ramlibacter sp.]|nr:proteinase inhibitor [Ramlibacter sp.]